MAKLSKPKGSHKRYRVSGVTQLLIDGKEMEPGDEFLASLDPDYEIQMLEGGHLEILQDQSAAADAAQAAGEAVAEPAVRVKTKKASE